DFEGVIVQRKLLTDHMRVGAKTAAPQTMTEHDDLTGAGLIFARSKSAAERRLDAERGDEIGGTHRALQQLRLTSARQRKGLTPIRGDLLERLAAFPVIQIFRRRHTNTDQSLLREILRDQRKPLRFGIRQRLQQHSVDDTEDRRVRANAESQRENSD